MKITDPQTIDDYYQALLDKNPAYLGVFYVGVVTTGVFCIATCYARKPKKCNVVFFTTLGEVMSHGFRPCKRCQPTQHAHQPTKAVSQAIELAHNHPKQKISDEVLRQHNISPSHVRRWFNTHYGMTFHAYQRLYRINQAYQELKQGQTATQTAFDLGYESLSGFGYTYKKLMGVSPEQAEKQNVVLIHRITTPLGPMLVCSTDKGICLLEFTDRKMLETELADIQKRRQATILMGENEHIQQLQVELEQYYVGQRQQFSVPLDWVGTDFQKQVWQGLMQIDYGETASYLDQAKRLGRPKAVRAVANANGYNKIAIIVPCHRVIGSDGSLTGYGGGLERKKWLLDHEAVYL